MPIEHVTRGLSFDNLYVEVSVYRYICDEAGCGNRQAFHDVPTSPYDQRVLSPGRLGWRLGYPLDDGNEQTCICPKCCEVRDAAMRLKYPALEIKGKPVCSLAPSDRERSEPV